MNQQLVTQGSAMLASRSTEYDVIEFVNGQQDCRDGIPHKSGMTESYDAGYAAQYELEQLQSTGVN